MAAAGAAGLIAIQLALPPDARAAAAVQPWEASANSSVFGIVPAISGASLTTTFGQSIAAYEQTETQASSATVSLGGLGYIIGNSPFCGQITLPTNKQPQPLTADSATGPSSTTTPGNLPGNGAQAGPGTESVAVSPNPEYATATTTPLAQSIGNGALTITGRSTSTVRYVAGVAQEADASVTENATFADGAVAIRGMTWKASQHAGPTRAVSSSFDIGAITITTLGIPLALPRSLPLASALGQVNAILGPAGISLVMPTQSTDPGTGAVSIGPLQVHFAGSSLENTVLSPGTGAIASLEKILAGQSAGGKDCSNIRNLIGQLANPTDTVVNVLVGAAEGAGGIDMDLGGASAGTVDPPPFANPLSGGADLLAPGALPPGDAIPGAGTSAAGPVPGPSALPPGAAAIPSVPGGAATAGGSPAGAAGAGAYLAHCVTSSPAGHPGCWKGLGTVAAGVVLAIGSGLLAADIAYGRRSRTRPRRTRPRLRRLVT
ncbi:MAG: hypothetical protein ACR2NJ_12615 [Acidimicrobiales bacterium]